MQTRIYLIIYMLLVSCLLVLSVIHLLHPSALLAELLVALCFVALIGTPLIYELIMRPLRKVENGFYLLKEQDFSSRLSPVGQADADRVVKLFNRLIDQLKNERLRLMEQNNFLNLLVDASPMGVVLLDLEGKISTTNPAARNFLETKGEMSSLEESATPLARALESLARGESRTVRYGNAQIFRISHLTFIDRGAPHPFYLIERLTTEVMRAERRAYEKVIRMIVHEVNNTVAAVSSGMSTTSDILRDNAEYRDLCQLLEAAVERQNEMSRFVTRFAEVVKIPSVQLAPASLEERVMLCTRVLAAQLQERNIELEIKSPTEKSMPKVLLDVVLFDQVITNILKNAMESIERDGRITVTLAMEDNLPKLEIADNGSGISPDEEQMLFTPFFTTKPEGQGIGLLFTREVLTGHGCRFSLRTGQDGITRFCIWFGSHSCL